MTSRARLNLEPVQVFAEFDPPVELGRGQRAPLLFWPGAIAGT